MSYRITARDYKGDTRPNEGKYHQVYGNHEFPTAIHNYLIANGCKLSEDGCFDDFEITDLDSFLEAMLAAHNEYMKDDSYWDFKPDGVINKVDTPFGLIMHCMRKKEDSYAFIVYNFYDAFENEIEWKYEGGRDFFAIKEGKHIYLSGY